MLVNRGAVSAGTLRARSPKSTPHLEAKLRSERSIARRLRMTDHALVLGAVGVGAGAQHLKSGTTAETWAAAVTIVLLWLLLLAGLRSRAQECLGTGVLEYQRVAHAVGLTIGGYAILAFCLGWQPQRVMLMVAMPLGMVSLLASRWAWRRWLREQRRTGRLCARVLVVGSRKDIAYVVQNLSRVKSGFHVVGVSVISPGGKSAGAGGSLRSANDTIETIRETACMLYADTIVVASRFDRRPDFVRKLSWGLEGTAANLLLLNRVTDVVGPRISFRPIEGLPMVQVRVPVYQGAHFLLKRLFDMTIAAAALVVVGLATPLIALCIKLDSKGPVFYSQQRVGRDGELFTMFKFRSMAQDAEQQLEELRDQNEAAGPLFKLRQDPRVTGVGRVLRKLSIDELPQFWNVLKGDMSVVGPRPPLPQEATEYAGKVVRRLYVKPGITGLWQVGGRSDLSWEDSVRLDLRYVENWSIMLDVQIMWRTARVLTRRTGAY